MENLREELLLRRVGVTQGMEYFQLAGVPERKMLISVKKKKIVSCCQMGIWKYNITSCKHQVSSVQFTWSSRL